MSEKPYVLGTSGIGAERLAIQGDLLDQHTLPFLQKLVKPNMEVLELGPGMGNATVILAKLLNHTGHVTALDLTPEYVECTQQNVLKHGYKNVTVKQCSLEDAHTLNKQFNLIYGRAVLHHLTNAPDAIRNLSKLLKPQGIIAFEEPQMDDVFCYPDHPSYKKLIELYIKLGEKKNIDFKIGQKLYHLYKNMGLQVIDCCFVQPALTIPKNRNLLLMFIEECKDTFVQAGFIDHASLMKLRDDIADIIKSNATMAYVKFGQIAGQIDSKV